MLIFQLRGHYDHGTSYSIPFDAQIYMYDIRLDSFLGKSWSLALHFACHRLTYD